MNMNRNTGIEFEIEMSRPTSDMHLLQFRIQSHLQKRTLNAGTSGLTAHTHIHTHTPPTHPHPSKNSYITFAVLPF